MKEYLYKVKGFGGLGQGDGLHAADACNVMFRRDALHKRHGYTRLLRLAAPITAMQSVRIAGRDWLLVYSGCRFYLAPAEAIEALYDITASASTAAVQPQRLVNRRIRTFVQDDKAYIVGCGDYLVLGYWDGTMQLRRVEDAPDTYIPTTSVGIGCKDNVTYLPVQLDNTSVGDYYYRQGEDYVLVTFDGDQSLPDPTVDYYRRLVYPDEGKALDPPNMLSTYRINTLYGTPRENAVYQLDAGRVDSDSQTVVQVATGTDGTQHYTLVPAQGAEVQRAPVVGDDLGGRTLHFDAQTVSGVGPLHIIPSQEGFSVLTADGGQLVWRSTGITSSAWNSASLVLYARDMAVTVATAHRTNWLSTYTVVWRDCTVTLPADFGVVQSINTVADTFPCMGQLPTLQSDLVCGSTVWGSLDYRTGQLTFVRATTPCDQQDNITVTYKARMADADATPILQATVGAVYGVGGNADRLFVGGSSARPYADYHSQSANWTYFTPDSRADLGQSGRIVGYMRRGQSLITLLTDCAAPNAYWRLGSWQEVPIEVGSADYTMRTASFAVTQVAVMPPIASDAAFATLADDNLYLSTDGLYSVYTGTLSDEKKTVCRSAPLADLVWDEGAVAIAHDSRYYLSNGHDVYVGDSRYRYTLYGTPNYEWVRWAIPGVTAWAVVDGALGFGTADGDICRFDTAYCDVLCWRIAAGQLALDLGTQRLHYDPALPVREGDTVMLDTPAYYRYVPAMDVDGANIYVDADTISGVYEGAQIYAIQGTDSLGPYTVGQVDWGKCRFVLQDAGQDVVWDTAPDALVCLACGRPMVAVDVDADSFALAPHADAAPVAWHSATSPLMGTLRRSLPVQANYTSEVFAIGSAATGKQLTGVSIGGAVDSAGMHFAVRNAYQARNGAVGGQHTMAMDWLRFDAFAFDGDFRRVYRARLKMRFHYLQWQIHNSDGADLAVDSVYLHYRYCRSAKEGVEE